MPNLTPALAADYEKKWSTCVVDYQKATVMAVAKRVLAVKGECVGFFNVPWWFIALIWLRESNLHPLGVLHNGEKIVGTGRKTTLVPSGRGPFTTWRAAAKDALIIKGLDKVTDWGVAAVLYRLEGFNGFGYRNRGVPSPYLWSHTNHYADGSWDDDPKGGKYVRDGVYDPDTYDKQIGVAAIMKCLEEMGENLFGPASIVPPPDIPAPKPAPAPAPQPEQPSTATLIGRLIAAIITLFRGQK